MYSYAHVPEYRSVAEMRRSYADVRRRLHGIAPPVSARVIPFEVHVTGSHNVPDPIEDQTDRPFKAITMPTGETLSIATHRAVSIYARRLRQHDLPEIMRAPAMLDAVVLALKVTRSNFLAFNRSNNKSSGLIQMRKFAMTLCYVVYPNKTYLGKLFRRDRTSIIHAIHSAPAEYEMLARAALRSLVTGDE